MKNLKLPPKSKVTAIAAGTVNPVHEIPAIGEDADDFGKVEIDLSALEGWEKLSIEQKRFLVEFSRQKLKEKRAALYCGVGTQRVREWKSEDPGFLAFYEDIVQLHVEAVEEVDYVASFDTKNNTSRGRFLANRSKSYNEEEKPSAPRIGTQHNQTNIFAILNSEEITKKGLAGVQKVFNQFKEQGKLPDQSVNSSKRS
jgi:hypothetical protein